MLQHQAIDNLMDLLSRTAFSILTMQLCRIKMAYPIPFLWSPKSVYVVMFNPTPAVDFPTPSHSPSSSPSPPISHSHFPPIDTLTHHVYPSPLSLTALVQDILHNGLCSNNFCLTSAVEPAANSCICDQKACSQQLEKSWRSRILICSLNELVQLASMYGWNLQGSCQAGSIVCAGMRMVIRLYNS